MTALLRALPVDQLCISPVARLVNNVKNDGPELLEPRSLPIEEPVLV